MNTTGKNSNLFERLEAMLRAQGFAGLRNGLIGKDAKVTGPFGEKTMLYADYVASGRALRQVEELIMAEVLPYYSNSHTEASFCGARMTGLRRDAREFIAQSCGATAEDCVLFTGPGATAGLNRIVHLFGVKQAVLEGRPVQILIGPYEHHSNVLPWRESGAKVVEIPEAANGGPDQEALKAALSGAPADGLVIGAFSAASNVTGVMTNVAEITAILNEYGALCVWDYAGGAPYLPITMRPGPKARIDALVLSPHKFIGGPGASGITVIRRAACIDATPSQPGGGTVSFVSPWMHEYSPKLEAREEAGTPNVIGDIRAALAFAVKTAIGQDFIQTRNAEFARRGLDEWNECPQIEILGRSDLPRLPIFSFRLRDGSDGYVHHQLVTRMLSDSFGIQARGGCACAGPYVHRLLDLNQERSDVLMSLIAAGAELEKPGFIRLNFSVLMSDAEVGFILSSVRQLSETAASMATSYRADPVTAIFQPV